MVKPAPSLLMENHRKNCLQSLTDKGLFSSCSVPCFQRRGGFLHTCSFFFFISYTACNHKRLADRVLRTGNEAFNTPERSVDSNLNTRWSAFGVGEVIVYDLGESAWLDTVKIAFNRGNERRTFFDLAISEDSTNWVIFYPEGESSGTTTSFESFTFPAIKGRYLKLIGKGHFGGYAWTSTLEVKIFQADLPGGNGF